MTAARTVSSMLVAGLVGGCAAASTPATVPEHPPHLHPSAHAMAHAFERVSDDALRCLPPGAGAQVAGSFDGHSGLFEATHVAASDGSNLPFAVTTCVRAVAERAHVRPFTEEAAAFTYVFTAAPGPVTSAPSNVTASTNAPDGGPGTMSSQSSESTGATGAGSAPGVAPVTGTMEIASRPTPIELIRRESDALQRCYEQAAERDQTATGTIELRITLDAGGRIVRMNSRVDAPPREDITLIELVARCIESHVRLIQFGPQPNAANDVVVPMTFRPGGIPID